MEKKLRVLIVEDVLADAEMMKQELQRAGIEPETLRVETKEDFLQALKDFVPDIIFSDYVLPHFDGLSALQLTKEQAPEIPFIMVTASTDEETAVACMKAGSVDYVIKAHLVHLSPAVKRALEMKRVGEERVRLEKQLWDSAREWRAIFDALNDSVALIDAEFRIRRCNKALANLQKKSLAEIINKHCFEIIHGTSQPIPGCPFSRVQESLSRESLLLRKEEKWFDIVVDPLFDDNGYLAGAVQIIADITLQKQVEDEIKRLSEENKVIAEIGRLISSTLNIEEVYERFSEEVQKLISFGRIVINIVNPDQQTFTISYVWGKDIEDRRRGDVIPIAGTAAEESFRTRSTLLFQPEDEEEVKNRFPGDLRAFMAGFRSVIVAPLISKDEVIGFLLLRSTQPKAYGESDVKIAERVAQQIAGAIANAHLFGERERIERERLALEEQFRQSQKMEAIGQLAGGIAHDFNNFLTIINGYSQLSLLDLKEGDPLRANIEEVKKAADRAAVLTRKLLAFSRRQIMEFKVLDLNKLIRNLERMLHRILGEDVELVIFLEEDLGRVKVDAGQIEQVVINLVVNAKEAMPQGGKLIIETANVELSEVFAREHVGVIPGRYVMISVSDTGVGMAAGVRERVFEPFFTTKEKGKGKGLGLSTVYGIVKQSGGNLWVYSELGRGTTFKIYLPRVDEPSEEVRRGEGGEDFLRGDETVLVVEDEEEVRRLAVQVLRKQGYRVLEASQGGETLLLCEEEKGPIHLMLTDVVMPKVSGVDLAKRLSLLHPEMKVLYMSGYTDDALVHHLVLEEGVNFMPKPFFPEALARKVRQVLDR